jgi:hypothetical protein
MSQAEQEIQNYLLKGILEPKTKQENEKFAKKLLMNSVTSKLLNLNDTQSSNHDNATVAYTNKIIILNKKK